MSIFEEARRVSTGFRVARLFRMNACLLERKVGRLGLCHGQIPYVLSTLEHGEQTQDALAAQLHVCPAATARALKNLEAAGFVTRAENPENRRQKLVRATPQAEAIADELQTLLVEYNSLLLDGFSEEERTQLMSLLDRTIANAEGMLKDGEACDA